MCDVEFTIDDNAVYNYHRLEKCQKCLPLLKMLFTILDKEGKYNWRSMGLAMLEEQFMSISYMLIDVLQLVD